MLAIEELLLERLQKQKTLLKKSFTPMEITRALREVCKELLKEIRETSVRF